jgi:hypothetical protein
MVIAMTLPIMQTVIMMVGIAVGLVYSESFVENVSAWANQQQVLCKIH